MIHVSTAHVCMCVYMSKYQDVREKLGVQISIKTKIIGQDFELIKFLLHYDKRNRFDCLFHILCK